MSRLTDTITFLYQYQDADIEALARQITERRKAAWINKLSELARVHGCNRLAGIPKGADARELERLSRQDAESIARTFNRDVRREVERIYAENPRANRQTYYARLEKWAKKRDAWKVYSISLNTDGTARQYAFERFYAQNPTLTRSFVAGGPPAVCDVCLNIFAMGIVDLAFVQANPLPAHINCPHYYVNAAATPARCETLWLG